MPVADPAVAGCRTLSPRSAKRRRPWAASTATGRASCCGTPARRRCSPLAIACRPSSWRSRRRRSASDAVEYPAGILDPAGARTGSRAAVRAVAAELGLDFASVGGSAERGARHEAPAPRIGVLGALGRHRLDRLDPLLARSAPRAVQLPARRGHALGRARRARWTCCSTDTSTWSWRSRSRACRRRGARCRTRRRRDAEPRRSRGVATTSRAASAARALGQPAALRGGGRPARDPRQRQRARRSRAASCAGCGAAAGHAAEHRWQRRSRRRARRGTRTPGSHLRVHFTRPDHPARVRLSGARAGCSARTSRSTTRPCGGCGWPTAPPASTAPRTGAAS